MLLGSAIGLTHRHATQPDASSKDLLPAMTSSHIRAHHEIAGSVGVCGFAHVCLCVIAVRDRESGRAIRELGVSSRGAAPQPQHFAGSHVLCLGLKSPPVVLSLQTICVTGRHLRMKEGCNLCLSYADRGRWGDGVTGGSGRSQSLCRLVHQPYEYSDYMLSADAATQSANLFQSC